MKRKCRHFWRERQARAEQGCIIFACKRCRHAWAADKAAAREQAVIDSLLNKNAEEA